MTRRDFEEARLARLIGATRADANPAVLARARARLAARPDAPRLALWLARPAVLAGAGALFVLCVAGAFVAARRQAVTATNGTTVITALLGEEDLGLPVAAGGGVRTGAAGDSGEVSL